MNDVKRFMRFVLPGLASVIMLLIALIISDSSKLFCFFQSMNLNDIGIILGLFLASGALGYIFACVYWGIYEFGLNSCIAIDNRYIFSTLKDKLEIIETSGNKVKANKLSKRDAWTIAALFWQNNINKSEEIKGSTPYVDRITDLTHGLGATVVGSVISLTTWILLKIAVFKAFKLNIRDIIILIVWLFLIYLIIKNYNSTNKALQSL